MEKGIASSILHFFSSNATNLTIFQVPLSLCCLLLVRHKALQTALLTVLYEQKISNPHLESYDQESISKLSI